MDAGNILLSFTIGLGATFLVLFLVIIVVRRLIGVQVGTTRIVLAGIVSLAAEVAFEARFVWTQPSYALAFAPIQIGVVVITAMVFLLVAEIILPQGSLPPISSWIPALRSQRARARRYSEITRIAVKHGLLSRGSQRRKSAPDTAVQRRTQARALRLALEEAGVTFVKLGQVLSTRPDLVPREYITELSLLQQDVPPAPWDQVKAALEAELGRPVSEVFAEFDPMPIAAASIGQVHRARLVTGQVAAVKVQRPGIEPSVSLDLDITVRLAQAFERASGGASSFRVAGMVQSFVDSLREELDYRVEAGNLAALSNAQNRHPISDRVVLPHLFTELSTRRVLTMEMLDGHSLSVASTVAELEPAVRIRDARVLFRSLVRQIADDGVFHSDLHPGNVMVLGDGSLALVDFGSVGRMDSELRASLRALVQGFNRRNSQQMGDAILSMIVRPDSLDEPAFRRALSAFIAAHFGDGADVDVGLFNKVVDFMGDYSLAVPDEIAAAVRAFAVAQGTLNVLEPGFDVIANAREYGSDQIRSSLRPSHLVDVAVDEALTLLPILRRLPRSIDQIASSVEAGRLTVNTRVLADERDRQFITGLVQQVMVAFLGAIIGIMATTLLVNGGGPTLAPDLSLYQLFAYLLVVVASVLIVRVLFDVFRRR